MGVFELLVTRQHQTGGDALFTPPPPPKIRSSFPKYQERYISERRFRGNDFQLSSRVSRLYVGARPAVGLLIHTGQIINDVDGVSIISLVPLTIQIRKQNYTSTFLTTLCYSLRAQMIFTLSTFDLTSSSGEGSRKWSKLHTFSLCCTDPVVIVVLWRKSQASVPFSFPSVCVSLVFDLMQILLQSSSLRISEYPWIWQSKTKFTLFN